MIRGTNGSQKEALSQIFEDPRAGVGQVIGCTVFICFQTPNMAPNSDVKHDIELKMLGSPDAKAGIVF